jgi:cell division septation protein DedD
LPKNEDGEFELILGNRQLLSVFFIVVILLGVFFTMGFIIGKNSATGETEVASRKEPAKPMVVDMGKGGDGAPVIASNSLPPAPVTPVQTAPQKAEPPAPVKAEAPKPEPVKPAKAEPRETPGPAPVTRSGQPSPGSYLQLAATSKREADVMVDVLGQKGFRAMAAAIPEKEGTFRVLVGPLSDGSVNKTKSDLQAAGFPGNAAIRRNY